jgi:hypothetical protein
MNYLIALLTAAKALTVTFGFVTPGAHEHRRLHIEHLMIHRQEIRIDCRIHRAFPAQLRELVRSGTPIPLYLSVEMIDEHQATPVRSILLRRTIVYDVVADSVFVIHAPRNDTAAFAHIDSALSRAATFQDVFVAHTHDITENHHYHLHLYTYLGKTSIEALKNKAIDLMYFWDFKRPAIKTESYTGATLLRSSRHAPDTR